MANGFGSLYIGASGLRNAQNALNTTANNMSNVDTVGYVRQQVRFAEMNYVKLRQPHANVNIQQSGLGVSIGDVVHARDIFLDELYRLETGRQEFYSVRYETADYVQDLMQEIDGEQFKQSIIDLWRAFDVLSTNPADSVTQNLVLEKSELLISRSQALYKNFQNYQANINEQIKEDVEKINEIGNRIYELNLQIQKVEAGHIETAMTLRDERDYLLDQLGAYGNIEVTEDVTGFAFVDFEGVRFVDEIKCFNIGLLEDFEDYGTGFYTPYWPHLSNMEQEQYVYVCKDDGKYDTETNTDVGGLVSKLMVRGYAYGRASDLADKESYDKIANRTVMKVEAQLDHLFSTIIKTMNDLFCPNKELDADITIPTEGGGSITIPAGTLVLDEENCPVGVDGELPPREIFVRSGCERYTKVTADDGKTYYIYNEEDPEDASTRYDIGNVHINEELDKQITLMPAYKNDGVFDKVDHDLGKKISAAWAEQGMKLSPYDAKPCTFEEFYERIVGELGVEGNISGDAANTLTGAVQYIDNRRLMVTGVSSDEELTKMIKYQSAYNAASRYITVISQMTELIVTGLI